MDAVQPFLSVALVLGLLCGGLWFLKSRGAAAFHLPRIASGGYRQMEVLERVSLGPQQALHLVRVADRTILIATGQASCQVLLEMPGPESKEK